MGLTEQEAAERGLPVRVAKLRMATLLRTRMIDESRGFAKALIAEP
ncbi:MAG: hypothetical protein JOZ62_04160 [Acidobacteriaceae bacterium]|nr:hypothetical protein [Acidobacteriaceae bacterium]